MKIAQVSPLYESVPPKCYGGTERVVSYLTEELVKRGHDVTLFASGDSITMAELRQGSDEALRRHASKIIDPLAYHLRMIEMVASEAANFDIVHFHIDYLHFPVTRRENYLALTTLHGRLDIPDIYPLFRDYSEMNLVSISKSQRTPLSAANWIGNVYHGLPLDLFDPPQPNVHGKYLAFLGRICPEKRPDRAIEIARRVGMPIKIAAKIDPADEEYFESKIRRLFDDPLVEYIGEIGEREKREFLGNAYALLFPIDWPEPFGLALIESLAAGLPVVAFEMGSAAEIIEDGVTGYLVHNIDEAVDAVQRIGSLDRRVCRRAFEKRFSVQRMCRDYETIFERLRHGTKTRPADAAADAQAILLT